MTYTVGELAQKAGVTTRTVRFYVEQGLLPPPEGLSRGAAYTDDHLERLERIREWKELRLSLDEIRAELARVSKPEFLMERAPKPPSARPARVPPAEDSASDYLARLRERLGGPSSPPPAKPVPSPYGAEPWVRIPLTDDVEIHVRRRGSRTDPKIARLIREARRILEQEDDAQ